MQPRSVNILAFLQSKGWTLADTSPKYYLLLPPNQIKFDDKEFKIKIPRFDEGKDTSEYLLRLTFNIAEIYGIDKYEMLEMLSKGERELKFDIERQKEILSMKESYLSVMAKAS